MCWTNFKTIGQSLNNLDPSQKTLRPTWCPKLVTDLRTIMLRNNQRVEHHWVQAQRRGTMEAISSQFLKCALKNSGWSNVWRVSLRNTSV